MSTAQRESDAPPSRRLIPMTVQVNVTALLLAEADGGYSVAVPALPGCVTEGDSLDEVRAHVKEAVEGWLASAHDHGGVFRP